MFGDKTSTRPQVYQRIMFFNNGHERTAEEFQWGRLKVARPETVARLQTVLEEDYDQ